MALWPSVSTMRPRTGAADEPCANRGTFNPLYCDADGNLMADAPKDKSKWKNLAAMVETLNIATLGTLVTLALAFPLGVLAARNIVANPLVLLVAEVAVTAIRTRVL
jgi:ABC-type phosphate/phosphonate transport system permease subunit